MTNRYTGGDSVGDPSFLFEAVTPDAVLSQLSKGIYVGAGGDIEAHCALSNDDIVFVDVPSGAILPIRTMLIKAANTTASDMVALL